MRARLLAVPALLLLTAAGAPPTLQQCAAIPADAERLACYDRLAATSPPPAAAAPSAADPVAEFGKPAKPAQAPGSLHARVVDMPKEWKAGTRFTLDNGQVWKAASGETGYYPAVPANPDVTISRSFFGAYWMEVPAISRKIKVQRVS